MKTFTKGQIIKIIPGLKANQVKYFTEFGGFSATEEESIGTGHKRKYSAENVCEFAIAYELSKYGMPLPLIVEALSSCKEKVEAFGYKLEDIATGNAGKSVLPPTLLVAPERKKEDLLTCFVDFGEDDLMTGEVQLQMNCKSHLRVNLRNVLESLEL